MSEPQSPRGYLQRNAIASLINSGMSALATAILLPIVIHRIGMQTYGLWAMLGIFIGFTSVLDLGIWKAVVYWRSRTSSTFDELLASALAISLGVGTAFIALVLIAAWSYPSLLGDALAANAELVLWLSLNGALIVFANLLTNVARGVMESVYRGHIVNLGYAALTFLLYLTPAVISVWSTDVRLLIAGSTSVYLVTAVIHWSYLRCFLGVRLARPRSESIKGLLSFGLRSMASDLPSIMMTPILLYAFARLAADSTQFGTFELALKIATLAATTLGLLATPFFSVAANARAENHSEVMSEAIKFTRITLLLAAAGWSTFVVLGSTLLKWFFGTGDDQLFYASAIMLFGAALLAALEPIARTKMGLAQLKSLSLVRGSMLPVATLSIITLGSLPLTLRFSLSAAIAYVIAAAGLILCALATKSSLTINPTDAGSSVG